MHDNVMASYKKIYGVANRKLVGVRNVGDFEISSYLRQDTTGLVVTF
jgi:hypothetical protein